jgi:hypothetical protein
MTKKAEKAHFKKIFVKYQTYFCFKEAQNKTEIESCKKASRELMNAAYESTGL